VKTRRLAVLTGLAVFTSTTVALHFLQPALSARDEAVSYYVHGHHGWLLTLGLVALGLASVALTAALVPAVVGPGARPGLWLLGTWSVGVLLGGTFPADPAGNWSAPPSLAGMIHGNAAMVAFLVLPIGALFLAKSFRRDPRWRAGAGLLFGLAVATAVSLGLFFASLVPVFIRPGPPILLGLTERVLLAVYVAWLAAVAIQLPDHPGRA
jgi:Protein of unknown function (DUF998)